MPALHRRAEKFRPAFFFGRLPAMSVSLVKPLSRLVLCIVACWLPPLARAAVSSTPPRQIIAKAILSEDDAQKREILESLAGQGDEAIAPLLTAWRSDELFVYDAPAPAGTKLPVQLVGDKDADGKQAAIRVDDG